MKLLVVAPYFYPKVGGMENYAWNISKGLKEKYRWDIVVITSNHEEKKYKEEIIEGIKIHRLPYWFKLSNTPINFGWLIDINKIINNEKPDVINGHTPVPFIADIAALVAKKENIPFILTHHNDLAKSNYLQSLIIKLYYSTLGKMSAHIAKYIIVTSDFYSQKSLFLKQFTFKNKVVPPGVDIQFYNSIIKNNVLANQYKKQTIILFVGQLDKTHKHKGLTYLIESIPLVNRKIKNLKLIVIGQGNMVEEYKILAKILNISNHVEFKTGIDNKQLVELYKLSDVVTLPSTSDSEGFGMVLIEAGACKKPVVGSNIGGIPYVVDDNRTGLLAIPKDEINLSQALLKILLNKKFAKRLGEEGYKKVMSEYTWDKQVAKVKLLFNTL